MKRQRWNRVNGDHPRIILLSCGRLCNREIASRVGCTPQWVREVIHRFNKGGLEAIEWYPYFQVSRRLYQKRPPGGRWLCIDEFGPLNLQPRHGHCWKGRNKRLDRLRATYHQHGGVRHFLAAYELETDQLFGLFTAAKTSVEFLGLLKWLRRKHRSGETLHIVLDNYGPHLKDEVLAWAQRHNIKFYPTPTNAFWLNRIESQFTAMKKSALENSDFQTHKQQQAAIARYLTWRNQRRHISIESWTRRRRRRRAA
jgi:transposase